MDYSNLIGKIVYSKAGRDADKHFIVVAQMNDEYVYISDGSYRKVENPKKKKIKHLIVTDEIALKIRELIISEQKVSNSEIRKFLQSEGINKEV